MAQDDLAETGLPQGSKAAHYLAEHRAWAMAKKMCEQAEPESLRCLLNGQDGRRRVWAKICGDSDRATLVVSSYDSSMDDSACGGSWVSLSLAGAVRLRDWLIEMLGHQIDRGT